MDTGDLYGDLFFFLDEFLLPGTQGGGDGWLLFHMGYLGFRVWGSYVVWSKILKGGYIADSIGEH